MATNDKQVIFSLVNVGKVYPPKRQVLREIYLGFYYGAKIGVLGLNGSGKSSLLKIIGGVDQNYTGEITRSKGYTVGLLEQEPQLDPDKTVKEIVEEGKKELVTMLHEYDNRANSRSRQMRKQDYAKPHDRIGDEERYIDADPEQLGNHVDDRQEFQLCKGENRVDAFGQFVLGQQPDNQL